MLDVLPRSCNTEVQGRRLRSGLAPLWIRVHGSVHNVILELTAISGGNNFSQAAIGCILIIIASCLCDKFPL